MVPQPFSRRTALAVAAGTIFSGCLASTPKGSQTTTSTTSTTATETRSASTDSWPQMGRDPGHQGYNPTMGSTCSDLRWKYSEKGHLTTPIVVNDTVYVTRGVLTDTAPKARVEAYDLRSGTREWTASLKSNFTFSAPYSDLRPIYHRGTLYFSTNKSITALDTSTGKRQWVSDVSTHANEPPVITGEAIYVYGMDAIVCLNHDGNERWRKKPGEMGGPGLPTIADNTVYVSSGRDLLALDPKDGSEHWRHKGDSYSSSVVATSDAIVRAGFDSIEVVESNGNQRWQATGSSQAVIRPAVGNATVYVADLTGNIQAHDLESGEKRWDANLNQGEWMQGTIPMLTKGAVNLLRVANNTVTVAAFDWNSGEEHWRVSQPGTRGRGPIPARDTYVFTTQQTPKGQRESKTITDGINTTSTLWAFSA